MALSRKYLSGMGLDDKQIESIIEAHSDTISGLRDERDKYKARAEKVPELEKRLEEAKGDTSAQDALNELQKKYDEVEKAHKTEVANLKRDVTNTQNKLNEANEAAEQLKAQLEEMQQSHQQELEAKQTELDEAVKAVAGERDGIQSQFDQYKAEIEAKEALAGKAKAYREQVLKAAGVAPTYLDDLMAVTKLDGINVGEDGKIEGLDELVEAAKGKWGNFIVKEHTESADVDTPPTSPTNGDVDGAHDIAWKIARERHERMYGKAKE